MDRRQVRKVVEGSSEDEVVCAIIDWRSHKEEDSTGDEDSQVAVVKGAIFSCCEAGDKYYCRPRQQKSYTPGFELEVVLP